MTLIRTLAASAAAAALVLAPAAPALAQEADTAPEMERSVPDALLDSFITAALSVSEIAEDYQGRMQAADGAAARQDLATEARTAPTPGPPPLQRAVASVVRAATPGRTAEKE